MEMEFHNIIELLKKDKESDVQAVWYRLLCRGRAPSARVGHTCNWYNTNGQFGLSFHVNKSLGSIMCIGGANPDGSFRETYILDLNQSVWTEGKSEGFTARYEHSAFDYANSGDKLKVAVFGGANETGNLNDIQEFDTETETWVTVPQKSHADQIPAPRTHHTTALFNAMPGNKLVVFGGGACSSSPTEDTKVYIYDSATQTWLQPEVCGEPPKPRQGHIMTVVMDKVYLHGGMSGTEFFDDLHLLDLDAGQWSQVLPNSSLPSARAGHGSVNLDKSFMIFGGLTAEGATNDLYSFHADSLKWTKYDVTGDIPSSRLDFAFTKIRIDSRQKCNTDEAEVYLLFLHGGMNAEGDVFDDAYVCYLKAV